MGALAIDCRVVHVQPAMELPCLRPRWTWLLVGALLLGFGAMSFLAVLGKSATYDEPLHVVGAMVHRYADDFRINPEDPVLFGWWASLPHSRDSLRLDTANRFYQHATDGNASEQWHFTIDTLYEHNADHAIHFLNASRVMFVILGMALGALIACWAYQIAGPYAALLASLFYCFDPNFLGHSSLVKNDVPIALMMCLLGYVLWRFGRDGGWLWMLLAAIVCGVSLDVKFSAIVFGPMAVGMLAMRSLLPLPWRISGQMMQGWRDRSLVVIVSTAAILISLYLITWGAYGLRYSATNDGEPINPGPMVRLAQEDATTVKFGSDYVARLSPQDFAALVNEQVRNGGVLPIVKFDLWMEAHHVFPEGWLYGFLFTYAHSLVRSSFLMGKMSVTGWWYYFPLAMLFKTPVSTLLAALMLPLAGLATWWIGKSESAADGPDDAAAKSDYQSSFVWTALALTIPPAIYFFLALSANLNLGVRHVLPIYPYLYIALGIAAATCLKRFPLPAMVLCALLIVGLSTETLGAYPNFLSYFNEISIPFGGGIRLLGDSNLDWGQDLPALAAWQRAHPQERLYFCCFGSADPGAYGIKFVNMKGGWPYAPTFPLDPKLPGVVAISATNLQGFYMDDEAAAAIRRGLKGERPFLVLSGTIYLYRWPPAR